MEQIEYAKIYTLLLGDTLTRTFHNGISINLARYPVWEYTLKHHKPSLEAGLQLKSAIDSYTKVLENYTPAIGKILNSGVGKTLNQELKILVLPQKILMAAVFTRLNDIQNELELSNLQDEINTRIPVNAPGKDIVKVAIDFMSTK